MSLTTPITSNIPPALTAYLQKLDAFIANEITPLQNSSDNNRFFDHRREDARTDWHRNGLPAPEWHALMAEAVRRADAAGFYRFSLPKRWGGTQPDENGGRGANLWMSVIREYLAAKGLGLFNDLQTEHSVVGNFPVIVMLMHFGSERQQRELLVGQLEGRVRPTFGLTEPGHGSDATWMDTVAVREERKGVSGWKLNGRKMWQTGLDMATHCFVFARTDGKAGSAKGVSCFVVPRDAEGLVVESFEWYARTLWTGLMMLTFAGPSICQQTTALSRLKMYGFLTL